MTETTSAPVDGVETSAPPLPDVDEPDVACHGVHLDPPGEHSRGYTPDKDAYLKRLRRIEGQVRGLQRMVVEDAYCIDVLTQVSAVTKALQSVALGLLTEHLGHCVAHAVDGGEAGMDGKIKEAADAISRLVRS